MDATDVRWEAIEIDTSDRESGQPSLYRVTFTPNGLMQGRGPNNQAPEVPMPPYMIVRNHDGNLWVELFRPPAEPFPGITYEDFEREALERVRKHLDRTEGPER